MPSKSTANGNQALLTEPGPVRRVEFVQKLETTRQEMHRFLFARTLGKVAVLILGLGGLIALADWFFVLDSTIRGAGLGLMAVAALVLFYRWAIAPRRHYGRQDAAAEVETTFPDLGQQVRTALEYVEPTPATTPALPGLVTALTHETDQRTSKLNLGDVIPWRSLRLLGLGAAALVVLYLGVLAAKPEFRIAAMRLFLLPVHYTQLAVEPGDQTLKAGEDLSVQATINGRPVKRAELQFRTAGAAEDWTRLSFLEEGASKVVRIAGTVERKLADCQKNLDYRVVADSVASPVYHVTVNHPLQLQKVEATIDPPAYTRRKPTTVKEGNFQVIEGSKVEFRITLDRTPQAARLQLTPTAKGDKSGVSSVPLQIKDNELIGQLAALDKEVDYEIQAEAADGMRLDAGKFHIKIQPDRKPTVRFVKPKEQIEVTPTTEVHMRLEAGDDFGLSKVGIVYRVGDGPPQELYLKNNPDQPTSLKTEAVLSLEDHKLDLKDSITYYAFVEDNHPTHPQRTSTELQWIDIRPFKRAFQMVEGGGC